MSRTKTNPAKSYWNRRALAGFGKQHCVVIVILDVQHSEWFVCSCHDALFFWPILP
jgi:hypothetical protein